MAGLCALFYKEGHKYNMKTHWPFGGFFLKLSDEKNGTHEYEDYLKECEEEKQLPEEELEAQKAATCATEQEVHQ